MQHITGSAAHIGRDYHTVTLRLTPTDNKLQTDIHWWGGFAKEGERKRGRRNKHRTTHTLLLLLVYIGYFVGSILCRFSMNVCKHQHATYITPHTFNASFIILVDLLIVSVNGSEYDKYKA